MGKSCDSSEQSQLLARFVVDGTLDIFDYALFSWNGVVLKKPCTDYTWITNYIP